MNRTTISLTCGIAALFATALSPDATVRAQEIPVQTAIYGTTGGGDVTVDTVAHRYYGGYRYYNYRPYRYGFHVGYGTPYRYRYSFYRPYYRPYYYGYSYYRPRYYGYYSSYGPRYYGSYYRPWYAYPYAYSYRRPYAAYYYGPRYSVSYYGSYGFGGAYCP